MKSKFEEDTNQIVEAKVEEEEDSMIYDKNIKKVV